jgi:hypothetical protein
MNRLRLGLSDSPSLGSVVGRVPVWVVLDPFSCFPRAGGCSMVLRVLGAHDGPLRCAQFGETFGLLAGPRTHAHARAHTRTHIHTRARAHERTHARTRTRARAHSHAHTRAPVNAAHARPRLPWHVRVGLATRARVYARACVCLRAACNIGLGSNSCRTRRGCGESRRRYGESRRDVDHWQVPGRWGGGDWL